MEIQEIETSELIQMYANADKTCSCGGHWKGSQNERLREEYAVELEDRGIKVPKTLTEKIEEALSEGVLDYRAIKKIIVLDRERHLADKKSDVEEIKECSDAINEIIEKGYSWKNKDLSERLRDIHQQRKTS